MSEEAKKKEEAEKECGVCANFEIEKTTSFFWASLALIVMLILIFWLGSLPKESTFGFVAFIWGVALLCVGVVFAIIATNRLFGRFINCFFDKSGVLHFHKTPPSTRLNAEGKTVYYFVPENAPSNAPLEDWDIPGPIMHLHLASWRSDSRVLNVEAGCADDLTIDRVKVVGEGDKSFISLRLRRKSWKHEAFVVSVASALKIVGEAAVKSSLAEHLFERIKDRQFQLDEVRECLRREEGVASTWKQYAVSGWARVNAIYEVLMRLEKALAASKSVSKSKIVADARVAVEEILESKLMQSGDDVERKEVCTAIRDALTASSGNPIDQLVRDFDAVIAVRDVPMLKKVAVAPAGAKAPPAPAAQQA